MKKMILSLLLTLSLQAGWEPGNNFVQNMDEYVKYENGKDYDDLKAGFFVGMVLGVRDTLIDIEYICIPSEVINNQIFKIVIKWVKNNPKEWNQSASYLIEKPLFDAFQCKKKK